MKRNRARRIALPVCLAAALAASGGALAATASAHVEPAPLPTPQLSIVVSPHAVLNGNRVIVYVPVSVTCSVPNATGASVGLMVTQAVGGSIAAGFGDTLEEVPCDGQAHDGIITVLAQAPGSPFEAGSAAVVANAIACEPNAGDVAGNCVFLNTPPQDLQIWRQK